MGLVLIFVFTSAFVAALVGLVIYKIVRRSSYGGLYVVGGCMVTFFAVLFIFCLNAPKIIDSGTATGFGVTAEDANKKLFVFKIPVQATDVNYYRNFFRGVNNVADFNIDERSFLAWVTENGWKMKLFVTEKRKAELDEETAKQFEDNPPSDVHSFPVEVYPAKFYLKDEKLEPVEIHYGFSGSTYDYEGDNSDCGISIYYDLDNSRAYIMSTNR